MYKKKLSLLNCAIASHIYGSGPSLELEKYLKNKVKRLIFVGHPFYYCKNKKTFIRIYEKGKLIKKLTFSPWGKSEFMFYVKDFFITLFFFIFYSPKIDIFWGVDNLNALAGNTLKTIGKVKKVIFYTIDYIPKRFASDFLNCLYLSLDRFVVKKSDLVWNLSSIMVKERNKRGINKKYNHKQIVVPVGTKIIFSKKKIKRKDKQIVFFGHLRENQGLKTLLESMSRVVKKHIQAKLLIIGGGPLENQLRKIIKRFQIDKNVKITGFIKSPNKIRNYLRQSSFAVAPYEDNKKTYTRYTDPGKPKDYLASSLPVIITRVPLVAQEIEKNKCGFAIEDSTTELAQAMDKLLSQKKLLLQFRDNALKMAKKYSWKKIFFRAIQQSI